MTIQSDSKTQQTDSSKSKQLPSSEKDIVDQESEESFPASDPPSWTVSGVTQKGKPIEDKS